MNRLSKAEDARQRKVFHAMFVALEPILYDCNRHTMDEHLADDANSFENYVEKLTQERLLPMVMEVIRTEGNLKCGQMQIDALFMCLIHACNVLTQTRLERALGEAMDVLRMTADEKVRNQNADNN